MVTIVKHEWHQVDSQFAVEIDIDTLRDIYPDKEDSELEVILQGLEDGTYDVEEIVNDALDNDVEIEWERQHDDWWTDRKGGYEITYELGDDSSWVDNTPPPPTHKCTKCKWVGGKYDTATQYHRADGSIIENYFESDEDFDHTSDVCPMCESSVELTTEGKIQEEKNKKLLAELESLGLDD